MNQKLEQAVLRAVTDTTRWLRTRPRGHGELEWKGHNNPVTSYDKGAERRIRKALASFSPSFVGEEYGATAGKAPYTAYIDPIDGTKSFTRGHAGCAVSLAVTDDQDHFIAAAVGDITSGQVYYANARQSIVLDSITGKRSPLRQEHPLPKKYILVNEQAVELFEILGDDKYSTQVGGIAGALGMAMTAAGNFDGIAFAPRPSGGPSAYDIAAGAYLMTRAGLLVTDYSGAPYDFLSPKRGVIAAPPELHARILAITQALGQRANNHPAESVGSARVREQPSFTNDSDDYGHEGWSSKGSVSYEGWKSF